MTAQKHRYQHIKRVTLIGALVNLVLAFVKIIVGYIGLSHALVVDGIHSLSDLISDALVIYASKHGSKSPDDDHPYGHARIETIFTVVFGLLLIIVGIGIIIDSVGRLSLDGGVVPVPHQSALYIALLSVLSKEVLYQYTLHYAKALDSNLLKANAWHHRSDAISSIVVLIGIGGSIYAINYLDIVAAVIVAMMIAKIGWDFVWQGVNELVDKGLDNDEVAQIRKTIESIPGVRHMHLLRTRQMGNTALVDVHVQVAPHISVSEGHRISDEVSRRLIDNIDVVSQVLVHIDCENDENESSCSHLPLRDEAVNTIAKICREIIIRDPDTARLRDVVVENLYDNKAHLLHYHNGKIYSWLCLPPRILQRYDCPQHRLQKLEKILSEALSEHEYYSHINLSMSVSEHKVL